MVAANADNSDTNDELFERIHLNNVKCQKKRMITVNQAILIFAFAVLVANFFLFADTFLVDKKKVLHETEKMALLSHHHLPVCLCLFRGCRTNRGIGGARCLTCFLV